jgi:hypothetical protein
MWDEGLTLTQGHLVGDGPALMGLVTRRPGPGPPEMGLDELLSGPLHPGGSTGRPGVGAFHNLKLSDPEH